ncbi:hypothetical protein ZIOFF_075148 [Zingiber officinale]|uniref:F-box domain-containing protein n=1 Tax=Zingiber officinale TaxID=94328 RepID=A0A8J5BVJ3_ZINOF|nr:hypothetical protein ZIOFF_075148 [Zingiber officinale]
MDALRRQASKLREQVSKQQQAVIKQFSTSGYGSSDVMVIDEIELQRHQQLEKLYKSTRETRRKLNIHKSSHVNLDLISFLFVCLFVQDFQKDTVKAAEAYVTIGHRHIEIGLKLSEDCYRYGGENHATDAILAKAAALYGGAIRNVEKELEDFSSFLTSQVRGDLLMDTDIVALEKEEREEDACDQYFLPYDLLLEIFSYLPAKMILQLQLLSRPFRRLAADCRFRLLQSQRHLAASGVFIVAPSDQQLDFFPLDNAAGLPPSFYAHLNVLRTVAFFLASSRGLLFFRYYSYANLLVLNPTCRERRMLPAPPEKGCPLSWYNGLAVNFLDNDDHLKCKYQLVYLKPMRSSVSSSLYQLCLYDSADGDWIVDDRQIDLGSPYLNLKNLVVFEGSLFVSFSSSSRVAAIDTSTRHVNFLPPPDSVSQGDEINVAVWEEAGNRPWLCLVHYDRRSCKFTLWRW